MVAVPTDRLTLAAPLVADGTLAVPVASVYPLEHIQDAVQHLLRGGKILLGIAGGLDVRRRIPA